MRYETHKVFPEFGQQKITKEVETSLFTANLSE